LAEDTKRFIKSHPNIIFTRADKDNVTVALNQDFYINQISMKCFKTKPHIRLWIKIRLKNLFLNYEQCLQGGKILNLLNT